VVTARAPAAPAPVTPSQLAHERKFLTVMFADLCGSTAQVSAMHDPEEAQAYLDKALRLMSECVENYGGTISQLLGDGLLALFGAPVAQEDHALRACLAAIAIQQRTRAEADERTQMVVRVGIHSGDAIVGSASEYLASHYRADGNTIHLASRLEQLAKPGTAVVSGATYRMVSEQLDAAPLGTHTIRGMGTDVELFELITGAQGSAAAPLAKRRQLAPLVGRAQALSQLSEIARQVGGGSLRIVGLRGDAGIGKSRVISELRQRLRLHGFRDHGVQARAYATNTPYGVTADLIRALLGLPDSAINHQFRESAQAAIASWPDSEHWHRSAVVDLLDLGEPGEAWRQLTPSQRGHRISDAVIWLIETKAQTSPLLLVIDDIFLADRDSLRLFESAARRMQRLPLLLCTTYRVDFVHRWSDASWFSELWIGPMPTPEMRDLALAMLGEHESLADVIDALVERADGNPLFLEQTAMTLVDDGTLIGTPGAYRCVRPVAELRTPASIGVVIGARVDRLPPAAKGTLEAAAVVGDPISADMVGPMQGIAIEEADRHLRLAQSSGLLNLISLPTGTRYAFSHGLVQDAVSGALTRTRKRALHRAAYDTMRAQVDTEGGADAATRVANHAFQGEAWAGSAEFALKSMSRSIRRSANRDALRMFQLGIDATQRLADKPELALPAELLLRLEALGAFLPLGQVDDIVRNLERAQQITRDLGDARREAAVSLQLAVLGWTRGTYRRGFEAAEIASRTAGSAGSRNLQMAAAQARMLLHHGLGHFQEVLAVAKEVEAAFAPELAARKIIPGWAVISSINLKVVRADVLCRMGQLDAAQVDCDEGYRELDAQEHAFSRVMLDFAQSEIYMTRGEHERARDLLQTTLKLCQVHDLPTMYPVIVAALAGATARAGEPAEALSALEHALANKLLGHGGRYNDYYFPKNLAITHACAGRLDEAIASASAAYESAQSLEQEGHAAEALALMAEFEAAAGREAEAQMHRQEARLLLRRCSTALPDREGLAPDR
jgi:class 3 adenylate cyclase/tetratricopeptide (TPR) repeat protein